MENKDFFKINLIATSKISLFLTFYLLLLITRFTGLEVGAMLLVVMFQMKQKIRNNAYNVLRI